MTEEIKLADKAINIQGKKYVLVSDRVIEFNKLYPTGMIQTKLLTEPDADMLVMMAKVTPNAEKPERYFTGYSQATWGDGLVNKTAALENCETSAVGRALAMMGIGVIDSIASVDEINKAQSQPAYTAKTTPKPVSSLKRHCSIHETEMSQFHSAKKNVDYFAHFENGKMCFGTKDDQKDLAAIIMPKVPEDETPIQRQMTDKEVEDINNEVPF